MRRHLLFVVVLMSDCLNLRGQPIFELTRTVGASEFTCFPSSANYDDCRRICGWWRPHGYIATVLNADENEAIFHALRASGAGLGYLGAMRDKSTDWFHWIEGPLRTHEHGKGQRICHNKFVYPYAGGNGTCPCGNNVYCNFTRDGPHTYPDNFNNHQWILYMINTTGTWDDTEDTNLGCCCRHETGTATTELSTSMVRISGTRTGLLSLSSPATMHSYTASTTIHHSNSNTPSLSQATAELSATSSLWITSTETSSDTKGFFLSHSQSASESQDRSSMTVAVSMPSRSASITRTDGRAWHVDAASASYTIDSSLSQTAVHPISSSSTKGFTTTRSFSSLKLTASESRIVSSRPDDGGIAFHSAILVILTASVTTTVAAGDVSGSSSVALLSILTCNPTTPPVSPITAFAISPFYYNGELWMAVGNLVLLLSFAVLHATVTFGVSKARGVTFFDACQQVCRFPALSLQLIDVYLPGAARGAVLLLANDRVSLVVSGISCLCAAVIVLVLCVFVAFRYVLPRAGWEPYDHSDRGTAWDACLYPEGRWLPQGHRSAWGPLMTTMVYRWGRLASAQRIMTALLAVASGLHGRSACGGVLILLGAAHVAMAAVFIWLKPHRLPMNRVLVPAAHLVSACVCFLRGGSGNGPQADNSSLTDTLALALQGVYGLLHAWTCLATLWIAHREAQWSNVGSGEDTAASPESPNSAYTSLRSAWQAWWYGSGGAGWIAVPDPQHFDDEAALQAILQKEEVEMLLHHSDAKVSAFQEDLNQSYYMDVTGAPPVRCKSIVGGQSLDGADTLNVSAVTFNSRDGGDDSVITDASAANGVSRDSGVVDWKAVTEEISTFSGADPNLDVLLLQPTQSTSTQVGPSEVPVDSFHELQVLYNLQQHDW